MDYRLALQVLGLDEDELTREHVRRVYLRKLREHPPEKDPEGFQRLRAAFERLRDCAHDDEPPPPPPPPPTPIVVVTEVARPLPPLAREQPREPLPRLMSRVLDLLQSGNAAAANAAAEEWRQRSDDFRQVSFADLARWELLRELLLVAAELPPPVTLALASALEHRDLALARPALEAYRFSDEKRAGEASSLLFLRANNIFKQIEGTLWIPRRLDVNPFQDVNKLLDQMKVRLPVERPRAASNSGASLALMVAGLILLGLVVRALGPTRPYAPPRTIPQFQIPKLINLPRIPEAALFIPPPMPRMVLVGESRYDLVARLMDSVRALQKFDIGSDEQKRAAAALEPEVQRESCKPMRDKMTQLEAAPPSPVELRSLYAKLHLQNMRQRIDLLCPNKKKTK
jgi:hypothetical protein